MGVNEEIILALSGYLPAVDRSARVRELLAGADPGELADLASCNGVSPNIYRNIRGDEGLPDAFTGRLQAAYYQTLGRNAAQLQEMLRIVASLEGAGVSVIPLKGAMASQELLGDPGRYPSDDIDILVRPEDLQRAQSVLEASGYRAAPGHTYEELRSSTYHVALYDGRFHVEVHWNLVMRYFDVPPAFWWEDTKRTSFEGNRIAQLSPDRYLIYLIFRAFAKGFYPLRYLVLAAALIDRHGECIDWTWFEAACRRFRMRRMARFVLSFIRVEMGGRLPAPAFPQPAGYGLFRDLVLSGMRRDAVRGGLRMSAYAFLLDTPWDICRVFLRRLFPPAAEVRLRYGVPKGSKRFLLFYLANPIMLIMGRRTALEAPGRDKIWPR